MNNILLTGSSGFLGKYIANNLSDNVHKLYYKNKIDNGIYCDLKNKNSVESVINFVKPNVIIHCAADPTAKHPSDHEEFIKSHILATSNLLEYSPNNIKFIYISSINVYGDSFPIEKPTGLYGACKLSCEKICEAYSVLKDLSVTSIRSCAIVGENTTHGLIHDIKKKLKSDSEYLELFGTENTCTKKPFVHISDVCNHVKNSIIDDRKFVKLDCFPKDSLNVKEVAEIIMDKLKIYKQIKWLGDSMIWKGDNKFLDTSKSNSVLRYQTSIEAIKNAV